MNEAGDQKMSTFKGIVATDTNNKGFKRTDIITVQTSNGEKKYNHFSRGNYGKIIDESGNIIIQSVLEGNFLFKIVGMADVVYYKGNIEIVRFVLGFKNKYPIVKYQNKTYDYITIKHESYESFSTKEFEIMNDFRKGNIEMKYNEYFMFECVCCAIDIWRRYWSF